MNRAWHRDAAPARILIAGIDGQSSVELALMLPILVLLLLIGMDFGRMLYAAIEVSNAARAGAQYGAQSLITAADSAGMQAAAVADGSNVSGLTATATQCTCAAGSLVPTCSAGYDCSTYSSATFVTVNTSATFTTFATYPGLPSPVPLSGRAIMQVQQ